MTVPLQTLAKIGTTQENAVLVNSLNSNYLYGPLMTYSPYTSYEDLSGGGRRGRGKPIITWEIPQATPEMADALSNYCPNLVSSTVIIYSRTSRESDEYAWFECIMNWPSDEDIKGLRREVLRISFTDCIRLSEPSV